MRFLFGKKRVQALAEVLENGREILNQSWKKTFHRTNYYRSGPMLEIAVRVQPDSEPPFEAIMRAGLIECVYLRPGVKVLVEYKPGKEHRVTLVDDHQMIFDRNPQLIKKQ